jgi:RimJ/RimL family protein N-acetyltransferase
LADARGVTMPMPYELRTERLVLRAWCGDDAEALRPVLLANQEHLKRWIPEQVYSAPPLPQLVDRLEEFAAQFAAGRAFRYAIRDSRDDRILGGMSLFPRDGTSRVQLDEADRVEVGYWLDAAVTGRGLATIGATALLAAAATLGDIALAEIHCHVENAPSNAVPRRLGFELAGTNGEMQIWRRKLVVAGDMSR